MSHATSAPARDETLLPGRPRLVLFAAGDFAFNLYWQSVMLYLLFYYTDTLGIGVGLAATTYLVASLWDGIAGLIVGILVDRHATSRTYRRLLLFGAPLLGAAFVLAYWPPAWPGRAGVAALFACHLLFRTAYALVNVPYLAMSSRVSMASSDRAFIAGLRMLAGTAAAVVVALGTVPIGTWLTGSAKGAFLGAALLFAGVGTVILLIVGATYREAVPPRSGDPVPLRTAFRALLANRAFVSLAAAMMAMIAATTALNKSVLYYFKYFVGDEAAGQLALAAMMAVSGAAIPLWMLLARRTGVRRLWFIATGLCIALLLMFAVGDIHRAGAMQLFLIALQVGIVGLNFALWAMLPDAVDAGERATGVRVEAALFGMVALLQRVSIGLATGLLGLSFARAGYAANMAQSPATLAGMRAAIVILPLAFFIASALLMRACPLGRSELEAPPRPIDLR